jgi:hypothetical protein
MTIKHWIIAGALLFAAWALVGPWHLWSGKPNPIVSCSGWSSDGNGGEMQVCMHQDRTFETFEHAGPQFDGP